MARARIGAQWQDDKLRQFEETFFEPLEQKVHGTVLSVSELAEILHKAERDIGDY
ncbi:MAG: hypothetical protein GX621_14010 [Pirellulaceae bacterium]|nr:hypothetical protein [Pirellulaceae bacterium]